MTFLEEQDGATVDMNGQDEDMEEIRQMHQLIRQEELKEEELENQLKAKLTENARKLKKIGHMREAIARKRKNKVKAETGAESAKLDRRQLRPPYERAMKSQSDIDEFLESASETNHIINDDEGVHATCLDTMMDRDGALTNAVEMVLDDVQSDVDDMKQTFTEMKEQTFEWVQANEAHSQKLQISLEAKEVELHKDEARLAQLQRDIASAKTQLNTSSTNYNRKTCEKQNLANEQWTKRQHVSQLKEECQRRKVLQENERVKIGEQKATALEYETRVKDMKEKHAEGSFVVQHTADSLRNDVQHMQDTFAALSIQLKEAEELLLEAKEEVQRLDAVLAKEDVVVDDDDAEVCVLFSNVNVTDKHLKVEAD